MFWTIPCRAALLDWRSSRQHRTLAMLFLGSRRCFCMSPQFVSAQLLLGHQVLYLIFKGSSFMNDFVANASVGPDYTPFDATFDDRTTFIHHGAHHAT